MKKYLLVGFLILAFSLVGFAQTIPKFKIEDFVKVKADTDKTAIYVGDRVQLFLEIVYPKDRRIEILTEDLLKDSIQASLPNLLVLEKAKVFPSMPWGEYWLKLKAVYTLFYPEKKDEKEILFNPIKIRFKLVEENAKEPRKEVEALEIETQSFALGIRSTLTSTSSEIRDFKVFSGKYFIKYRLGLIVGLIIILLGLSIPIKALISFVKDTMRGEKKISIKKLLKKEYRQLLIICGAPGSKGFCDSFSQLLRNLIKIKTGLKTSSMTSAEIKQAMGRDRKLAELSEILGKYEDLRYNPKAKISPEEEAEMFKRVEKILLDWLSQYKRWRKLRAVLKRWRGKNG